MKRITVTSIALAIGIVFCGIPICLELRPQTASVDPNKFNGGVQMGFPVKHHTLHIPVLMYHDFEDLQNNHANVRPADFYKQLYYLKSRGYQTISNQDLNLFFQGREKLPSKPLMITMDDGYQSNYDSAYPILKELGMKATIFVIVSSVGKTPGFTKHFDWNQAKEMYDSGLIDIENHTNNLHYDIQQTTRHYFLLHKTRMVPALTNRLTVNGQLETEDAYEKRVRDDLLLAKQQIEQHVGNHVEAIAYPFGATNQTVMRIAAEIGLRYGYVINNKVANISTNDLQIDRIAVDDNDTGIHIDEEITQGIGLRSGRKAAKGARLDAI